MDIKSYDYIILHFESSNFGKNDLRTPLQLSQTSDNVNQLSLNKKIFLRYFVSKQMGI